MTLTYEHKQAMSFIGFSASIRPEEGFQKCPEFWNTSYNQRYARLWQTGIPETQEEEAIVRNQIGMYALCIMHGENCFEYMIAGLYQGGSVPDGMSVIELPESDYAVVMNRGPLPTSLQRVNTYVWQEWLPGEGANYLPNGDTTIEVYSAANPQSEEYECGMWIPIQKKTV